MSKIVTVKPKCPPEGFKAIRWEKPEDWVKVCEFAGWEVGDPNAIVEVLEDSNGNTFELGDWLVRLDTMEVSFCNDDFRKQFEILEGT